MQFNVTDAQADQILNSLAMRPFNEVAPLINELVMQVNQQKQPATAALQGGALNGAGAQLAQ